MIRTPSALVPILATVALWAAQCAAQDQRAARDTQFETKWPGKQSSWNGHTRFDFEFDGKACFVVAPDKPAPGAPWVWRARFPNFHAEADQLLVERGFHIAHINTGGMLGSPRALAHWDKFYELLTDQHGLSKKVSIEAAP